jgi:hypothetical protein
MSATSRVECATAVAYEGGRFSSGLTTSRRISVATCVYIDVVSSLCPEVHRLDYLP